jgi:hypothetical protein
MIGNKVFYSAIDSKFINTLVKTAMRSDEAVFTTADYVAVRQNKFVYVSKITNSGKSNLGWFHMKNNRVFAGK